MSQNHNIFTQVIVRLTLLLFFIVAFSGLSHAQNISPDGWNKLDPTLRLYLSDPESMFKSPPSDPYSGDFPLIAEIQSETGTLIGVFIRFEPGTASQAVLPASFRGRVFDFGIAAGYIHPADLMAILDRDFILHVESSGYDQISNDRAMSATNTRDVHIGRDLLYAYGGKDVVVGVLDSGIDFSHPDFSDANGSRIQFLLEYKSDGTQQEWTKEDIDLRPETVTQRDGLGGGGHGTHVTGTAAGGGRAMPIYRGAAYESDIIFVKGIRNANSSGGFSRVDIANGVAYIFEKAAELGKPAVVNLSLGGHTGPHDGTTSYELVLQNLTGPGRIIVAAAGNEGFNTIHSRTELSGIQQFSFPFRNTGGPSTILDSWFEENAVQNVRLAAYRYENNSMNRVAFSDWYPMGTSPGFTNDGIDLVPVRLTLQPLGAPIGYFAMDLTITSDPRNGDGNAFLFLSNNGNSSLALNQYIWALEIQTSASATGMFHVWAASGGLFYTFRWGVSGLTEVSADRNYTVGSPGTARNVVTVGSYSVRDRWTDIDGSSWSLPEPREDQDGGFPVVIGEISYFSSRGPTRDNRMKPEIAAPGSVIISSLSSHFNIAEPGSNDGLSRSSAVAGGKYRINQGTSMSAPVVTGIVALMLQLDPTLTYNDIMYHFQNHSLPADQLTGPLPNNRFGYGKIDAFSIIKELENALGLEIPDRTTLAQNYPNPFNPNTTITWFQDAFAQTTLEVYDVLGRRIATLADGPFQYGYHSVVFDARGLASGTYFYRLQAGKSYFTGKMLLVK